jgi:leucyl-tRNA synthetase
MLDRSCGFLIPSDQDAFGLNAGNAASAPDTKEWTYANIDQRAASQADGHVVRLVRLLRTSDPGAPWTQWLFLRFFQRGLAYRRTRQ